MATKKLKTKALVTQAPQTREQVVEHIRKIGDLTRDRSRLAATMNDGIAALQEQYAQEADPINERIEALQAGVHVWCEANRAAITDNGKVKYADFVTGTVKWRAGRESVGLRKVEAIIEALKRHGLHRFVRVKEEVNKDAILADKQAVAGIVGITINSGDEEFVIEPHEQELTS